MPKKEKKEKLANAVPPSLSYKERQERSEQEIANEERYYAALENYQNLKSDITATEKALSLAKREVETVKNERSLDPSRIYKLDTKALDLELGQDFAVNLMEEMFPDGEPKKEDYNL